MRKKKILKQKSIYTNIQLLLVHHKPIEHSNIMNEELLSKDPLNKIISKLKGDSTIRYITFNVNG